MKVLITTDWYSPAINGVVTSVINLRKELQSMGHEVKILTLSQNKQSYEKDGVTYIGSYRAGKIYPGARVAVSIGNRYLAELVSWQPDVIHSQTEFSTFFMVRKIANKLGVPIVHTYHTVYEDYTHYVLGNKKWGKAMVAFLTKKVISHTQCVIAPTEKVRSLLVNYGVNQDIRVVPTGLDFERFAVPIKNTEKQRLRERLGIPENNKVLVNVGRIAKEKNLEEIILFVSQLKNMTLTLLIVGDGPHRKALEQYAEELGISPKVIFTGMVSPQEVAGYYQLGDVFVSASNSETQGLTYVEALANGVPALCRQDSCLKNVIQDGINGWQYVTFDQFAEKLDSILSQGEYERLSQNARVGAIGDYSSSVFAQRIEQIYLDAIRLCSKAA